MFSRFLAFSFLYIQGCGDPEPVETGTINSPFQLQADQYNGVVEGPYKRALELCAETNDHIRNNDLASMAKIQNLADLAAKLDLEIEDIESNVLVDAEAAIGLADCLDKSVKLVFYSFDSLSESAFFETRLEISSLLDKILSSRQRIVKIFLDLYKSDIFDRSNIIDLYLDKPNLRKDIFSLNPGLIYLSQFARVLKERPFSPDLENSLMELVVFANEEVPQAHEVKVLAAEAQPLFIKVIVLNIVRNSFRYSTRRKQSSILFLETRIDELKKEQGICFPSQKCKNADEIATAQKNLKFLKDSTSGPLSAINGFRKSLEEAAVPNALELVKQAMLEAKLKYEHEFPMGSISLREGDVWTQLSQGGQGDFLMQAGQIGTLATHSGLVVREWEDGFPIWFTAEMGDGAAYGRIDSQRDRIYLRPVFFNDPGFTAQTIKNLDLLGKVKFDQFLSPGIYDSKGKPSLYCSELIHFFFKNRFDEKGPTYPSPFDGMRNSLLHTSAVAQKNVSYLGINPKDEKYAPESMHYSPNLNFVGYTQSSYFSDEKPDVGKYTNNLMRRFNSSFAEFFTSRPFAPVPSSFKRKIDAAIFLGNVKDLFLPFLSSSKSAQLNAKLSMTGELPEGQAKYYVARMGMELQRAQADLYPHKDANGDLPPNWKEILEENLKNKSIPSIENIFEK